MADISAQLSSYHLGGSARPTISFLMMRTGPSILLAGPMAVGKSSVSRLIVADGFEPVSFGGLVQSHAVSRGMNVNDRSILQRIGTELHTSLGAAGMVDELLALVPAKTPLVVDGVRHLDVLAALRKVLDCRFVYLTADESVLRDRWIARGGDALSFEVANSHEVESQQDALKGVADLVVDTTSLDTADVVDHILRVFH